MFNAVAIGAIPRVRGCSIAISTTIARMTTIIIRFVLPTKSHKSLTS